MSKKFPHIIKQSSGSKRPQKIIFFDTETFETKEPTETRLQLKLGVACYRDLRFKTKKYLYFNTPEQFWAFVVSKCRQKEKLFLVAHNVAFDFRVVRGFEFMKKEDFTIDKFIYQGTTNIFSFKRGKETICVIDNMNFFKSSLATLGKNIGLDKMEMPSVEQAEALQIYCQRDVDIMVRAWELYFEFLDKNDLGSFALTIAGQAFSSYRHRFMPADIYVHDSEHAVSMERESYHGGRTECFKLGEFPKDDYFLLDVNSMYPSVMRDFDYPRQIYKFVMGISVEKLREYLKDYCVIARVVVDTDSPVYAVKKDNRLVFPVGRFETTLTTRELIYAISKNHVVKVNDVILYFKDNLFKNYVDFFYFKKSLYKEQGNESFCFMTKLFLNSLYGKFGQRNEEFEKCDIEKLPTSYKNMLLMSPDGIYKIENGDTLKKINGDYFISTGLYEGVETFVSIASHITADARMKLWRAFETAGRDNVFYCDTDSIITNTTGYNNCVTMISKQLGDLSLKEKSDRLIIRGAKDYIFADDEVIKGIRKNAVKISDNAFRQTRFEGLAGALHNNRLNEVYISDVVKELKRDYKKGEVMADGLVMPFAIDN